MNALNKNATDNLSFICPYEIDEFLPPVSRWTSLAGIFLVGTVGVAITLASIIEYNVSVKATATVRPVGEQRIVQANMEGTVENIKVKENQTIQKGDVIANLATHRLQSEKSQLQGKIQMGKMQLAQIEAQIKALSTQISAQFASIEGGLVSANFELIRTKNKYREQKIKTVTDVQEAEAYLQKSVTEMKKIKADLNFAKIDIKRYQQLAEAGAISKRESEENKLAVEQKSLAVATQYRVIEIAKARLVRSKAVLDPSSTTVLIAQQRIIQERARGNATIASLKREREALIQHKVEIQKNLDNEHIKFQQIDSDLKKRVIRAPSDGVILKLNLRNQGQVVRNSDVVAKLTPIDAPLVIKAKIAPQNIDRVAVGQKVQLRVSACPYPDFGTLEGVVKAVSPDAIVPVVNQVGSINQNLGASYYEVTVQPERLSLVMGTRQCRIKAGMEASADIISKKETALQFLLRKVRLLTNL